MMKIIGLTGGSGAGKGAAAACFSRLGAGVVDADAVYRGLCRESRPMLAELAAAFGDVLTRAGELDRARLAQAVFSDGEKLELLNRITFPYIRAASMQAFSALSAQGCTWIVYDAPTLFQTGADAFCTVVVGVIAAREVRLRRIIARDKLSHEAAAARIDAQPDDGFYHARCQHILENNGDFAALCAQVESIFGRISGRQKEKME